ncbi:hypothetical protein JTE90_016113 [Oedothorax gibbosus]|uniref:TGF-beta family profile domain-containing protein n=1 Tax=Oedothorax gibbosus TaxID=931172 RepID=A0AAV6U3Y4_9ARAC|nr:hypothetical protein JTE90_016113 [Oedothorax gibbosus]
MELSFISCIPSLMKMVGFGKMFELGLILVILAVEVSSRPERYSKPSSVMDTTSDKTDPSSALNTFSLGIAEMTDLGSSMAIYTSESLSDIASDASTEKPATDESVHLDSSDDYVSPNPVHGEGDFRKILTEDIDSDVSDIALDASTDADTTDESVLLGSFDDSDVASDTATETDEESEHLYSSEEYDASDPIEGDIRNVLIEDLKKRILRGLKLDDAPTETVNDSEFSKDMVEILQLEKEVTRTDQKENIIVHASNKDFRCQRSNASDCRRVEFNITSDHDSVISVHAWFRKVCMSDRLVVRAYSPSQKDELIVTLKEPRNKTADGSEGWASIELPKPFVLESNGEQLVCHLEIEGATFHTGKEHSPLMVVTRHTVAQEDTPTKRTKRSTVDNCTACCVADFNVTVEEIGWQDWVHEPRSFNIRMCKGQCSESLSSYTLSYQHIISAYYKINKDVAKPKCNFWAQRCKPSSYKPLRIMYKPKGGGLHDQVLKDVVIESCRCM